MSSVGFSALFGFFVVMAFLFSIQDFDKILDSDYGQPVLQIFVDVFGEDGAIVLFTLLLSKPNWRLLVVTVRLTAVHSLRLALRSVLHDQQQPDDVCLCSGFGNCKMINSFRWWIPLTVVVAVVSQGR